MRNCSEDVNELDVKPDGSWRVKGDAAPRDLSQWHMPDGTLCDSKQDTNPGVTSVNEFNREGTSDGHRTLKLGIKKTPEGLWQVSSKADDKKPVVRSQIPNNNGFATPIVPMISSPTGSYRDGEDTSVNQEGGSIQFDISLNQEFDSFAHNFGQTYNTEDRQQQPQHNAADVIILSDSDEENDPIVPPPAVYATTPANGDSFPFVTDAARSGYPERYQEDAGVGTSGLGLLSNNTGDFEINNWQMHSYPQPEQAFQFFGTDTDVVNPFVGPHNSFNIAPEDYSLDCNVGIEDPSAAHDVSICRNSNDVHGSLVDNPLALAGDDPSLQIFLPSQPSTVPLQEDLSERANTPNGVHPDDWRISLTLAAGGGGNEESTSVGGLKSQPKVPSKEAGVEPLLDAGLSPFYEFNSSLLHFAHKNNGLLHFLFFLVACQPFPGSSRLTFEGRHLRSYLFSIENVQSLIS